MNKIISHIQKIILWVSGCDLDTIYLHECKSDRQKFLAIGMVVLMTTLLAFVAGTAAAWWFTQTKSSPDGNLFIAAAFGCLWAFFVFCIDRCLVITIKKKKNNKWNVYVWPFIIRACLAVFIAAMISIPAEILLFKGKIDIWENRYSIQSKIDTRIQATKAASTISRKDVDESQKRYETKSLEARISMATKDSLSNVLKKVQLQRVDKDCGEYVRLNKSKEEKLRQKKYVSRKEVEQISKEMERAKSNWEAKHQERISILNRKLDSISVILTKITEDSLKYFNSYIKVRDKQLDEKSDIEDLVEESTNITNNANLFLVYYEVLERAIEEEGNETDKIFLWFIRILFWIFEICPTFVKLVSPIGIYEIIVEKREEDYALYFESDEYKDYIKDLIVNQNNLRLEIERLNAEHRIEIEKKLLDKIRDSKIEISDSVLNSWKNSIIK